VHGKITVLTLVRYYLPGFKSGGPLRSIAGMVDRLGKDFHFKIIASDRDLGSDEPYERVTPNAWNPVGGAEVYYCSTGQQSLGGFRRLISETKHDVLYLNSFFDPVFTLRPLLLRRLKRIPDRPLVLAPRGEFSEGALRLKAWKKRPYISLATKLRLLEDILWQASSKHEAEDIRRVLGNRAREIMVAVDLAAKPKGTTAKPWRPKGPGALRVLFLSRISRKKNLDGALRILSGVRARVDFTICGPVGDEGYWKECQSLREGLPETVTCAYRGAVDPNDVPSVMAEHDLFFLPTHGENFGHVILEALLAGTPVLVSDQTPWRELENTGVGWDIPLHDTAGYQGVIEKCAGMDAATYQEWRARVREYGIEKLEARDAVQANRELFHRALAGRLKGA